MRCAVAISSRWRLSLRYRAAPNPPIRRPTIAPPGIWTRQSPLESQSQKLLHWQAIVADLTQSPDSFVFKTDRPWPNPPLEIGAIVGHATPDSVRLWLRTGRTGQFTLLLSTRDTTLDADAKYSNP